MIEFSDYQCSFCGKYFRETYPLVLDRFVEPGLIDYVVRHFPLEGIHPIARKASEVSECTQKHADDIDEGYAAFYDTDHGQIVVYALTMRTVLSPLRGRADVIPFTIDHTFGMIVGTSGACRDAVVRHIKELGGTIEP